MVKREDVLKFLKALDASNVQNRDVNGNVVAGKSVELRKEYASIFLELFEGVDIQVWETTTRLVIERKKPWPTPEEMMKYVGKVETAYRAKQESAATQAQEASANEQAASADGAAKAKRSKQERMQEMFALALQGKFKEAADMVASKSLRDKAIQYGRLCFPDAGTEWYEENLNLLKALCNQQEVCDYCEGIARCRTKGYSQAGVIDNKTGELSIVMIPCMLKKVEKAEDVGI